MSRKETDKLRAADKRLPALPSRDLILIRVAFALALVISTFLAWQAIRSGSMPGCGPDSGCDRVLNSRWSRVMGLPVSVPAVLLYITLLGATFKKILPWPLLSILAAIVVGSALWFVILQVGVIHAFCTYCMIAHVAGVAGALLLLRNTPAKVRGGAALTAFAAVLILAAAQALSPAPAPRQIQMAGAISPEARIFSIMDGEFKIDLTQVPVSGDLNGTNRLVKLFDYTCHHCRDLHNLMKDYKKSHNITVISLPVPLDPNCNSLVKKYHPDHLDACEYARAGLAVFYAQPSKFTEFSDWLFTPSRPYSIAETRAYAANLVGSNAFHTALQNPQVDAQIRTDVAIYIASSRRARNGSMPQMIFQNSASLGAIADTAQLQRVMEENLKN